MDSLFILRSFTQFEARIYEQALLTHYIPKLNSSYTVVFPFNSWQKGAIFKSDTYKPIVIKPFGDETSDFIMEFSSKNRAAISLGIPKTTFYRYVNLKNHSVYSPILEMDVFLIDKSKLLSEDSPNYSKNDNLMQLTGVDLYGFEKGKLFALLLDKKSIFGVYNNASQAAKSLDGKSEVTRDGRAELISEITNLLFLPSNYEYRENGKIWIISENRYFIEVGKLKAVSLLSTDGTINKAFESFNVCANFLGVAPETVRRRIKKSILFQFDNKSCYLK